MTLRLRLLSAADSTRLGAALAAACPWEATGPRLLHLSGAVGSGKTTVAAALLAALGVREAVCSPSYALLETYRLGARLALHVDCYRLREAAEIEALGLRDHHATGTLWLVEWPERAGGLLPAPDLRLALSVADAGRLADLEAMTQAGATWLGRTGTAMTSQS